MDIRNIAVIAHVDHGKTSIVDELLKQSKTFRENEQYMTEELIMDSNAQEKERGITILAKNTTINYKGTKINIIDTPGHSDFSGEVERTLNMAEGALLIVDAKEGPMPQTRYVLKKAMELGLKVILIINKIDKKDADAANALNRAYDLFLDVATKEEELEFPVYYAVGREGKAWKTMPENYAEDVDLTDLFEGLIEHIPAPKDLSKEPFKMLVSSLDWDSYKGKYAMGKVLSGKCTKGMKVSLHTEKGTETAVIENIYTNQGLVRIESPEGLSGDIVYLTGIKNASIGDTISDLTVTEALPRISVQEPTLKIAISPNTSPFLGREGKLVTSRHLKDRLDKELETNVSLKLEMGEKNEFLVSGRGELHLSVLLENMRREGFEMQVGKPQVIVKEENGVKTEPFEELSLQVPTDIASSVTGEVVKRKGMLTFQQEEGATTTTLVFEIPTRGTLGLRNLLLTLTKGNLVMNSSFIEYRKVESQIPKLRNGVLVASATGKANSYGLDNAQKRGVLFITPGIEVYEGMVVGLNSRNEDMDVNVTKTKNLTNTRSSGSDDAVVLSPPTVMDLEQSLNFLEDDELLELTPNSIRIRKRILNCAERARESRRK